MSPESNLVQPQNKIDKKEASDNKMYYFLCVRPPKYVSNLITVIKSLATGKTDFSLPPHLTGYPPFTLTGFTEKEFVASLRNAYAKQKFFSITITLEKVGAFDNNRVVFFKPNQRSINRLKKMQSIFIDNFNDKTATTSIYIGKNYNPHMTIDNKASDEALRITHETTSKLPLNFTFEVRSLYLYQALKEEKWRKMARINLGR